MVEIEHGALGALEKDALVLAQGVPQQEAGVFDIGAQRLGRLDVALALLVKVADVLVVGLGHHLGLGPHHAHDPFPEALGIDDVLHAHALPRRFVGVGRPDAPARGTDLALAQPRLLHVVQHDVVGHDEMRFARHLEVPGRHFAALEIVDLRPQHRRVDDDAVADDRDDVGVEHTGRHEVKSELTPEILDCVAGVVAALIPDHHIGLLAQQIGDFPFAFVAPLGAYYDENRHVAS